MMVSWACNKAGLRIIEESEGLSLHAYRCPAGKLTVGYGHTGPDVHEGMTITAEQAHEMLEKDIAWAEHIVSHYVRAPLNQNQFSALVSFVFNVGVVDFTNSTLLSLVNAREYPAAADEFLKWDHCNGAVLPGLLKRREAERALFLQQE